MAERDFLDISVDDAKIAANKIDALAFASKYLIFTTSDDGKALLAHWETTLHKKRTPVGAPIQEYAANEAMRSFVQGIKDQIEIAQTGRFS